MGETMLVEDLEEICQNARILYIEDEPITLNTSVEILSEAFNNITAVSEGKTGLSLFEQEPFDLIISDINMPELNGVELVKSIRKSCKKQPIIITSSSEDKEHFIGLINAGITQFIPKPIDYNIMVDTIRDTLYANHYAGLVESMREQLHAKNDELSSTLETLKERNEDLEQHIRILETRSEQLNRLIKAYMHLKKSCDAQHITIAPKITKSEPEEDQQATVEFYFDSENQHDLKELEEEMDSIINRILMTQEIRGEKIFHLAAQYRHYAATLRSAPRFLDLADSITHLAVSIEQVDFDLADKNKNIILQHLESFTFTLINWRTKAFAGKLKDINLFDQSLMADVKTICHALKDEYDLMESDIEFF